VKRRISGSGDVARRAGLRRLGEYAERRLIKLYAAWCLCRCNSRALHIEDRFWHELEMLGQHDLGEAHPISMTTNDKAPRSRFACNHPANVTRSLTRAGNSVERTRIATSRTRLASLVSAARS
jgi:hypothetical protein